MKTRYFFILWLLLFVFACQPKTDNTNDTTAKPAADFEHETAVVMDGKLNPEVLWNLGRLSGTAVSPDGSKVLYGVSLYSIKQNKSHRELFVIDLASGQTQQISQGAASKFSEAWRPDGQKISYLQVQDGKVKLFEIDPDGSNPTVVQGLPDDITNYRYAPDLSKILFTQEVKVLPSVTEKHPDLPQTKAHIWDDLMFKHWDHFTDESFSHVFVASYNATKAEVGEATDLMPDEKWDSPVQPWGGIEEIAFSPDGKEIAYTAKKKFGKDYALSTNSDIYLYNIDTKETRNISEGEMGYDKAPSFSPDGKYIVWTSMARDGFEADQERIMLYERGTNTRTNLSTEFDQSAAHLVWSPKSDKLYFISGIYATYQLYELNLADLGIRQITDGDHNYQEFDLAGDQIIASRMSMSMPTELYKVAVADGHAEQLSFVNKPMLDKLKMGRVEKRWITTTDQKRMLTWVIYPPDFDPNKKYPTLLYCQGGPQSAVSQFWSYRWNFQIMAANGYIIVAPNRRGLPTFGQEWNDQISRDYGGQNILDYFSAIDELAKEPYVDASRLGAVGASYGGYSVFHLAGVHQKRFKTFIAHAGIFNFDAMYGSTEELFFVNWDLGGPYWAPEAKNSYAASPHKFVDKWDTPIMIIHGQLDYRIPVTQAMSAFTAAKLKGLKTRFLYFPDENHWVLKPQNGILWQREFFRWLDETL